LTTLAGRSDFAVIGRIITPKSRVLDLGCGEGELLEWLIRQKQVTARGVEISPARVRRAIARGVSAFQGDLNEGLADFPDNAFDYVILSQTLQETHQPVRVIEEMLRVGKRAIVSFPNFGHWSVRANMLFTGRSPRTKAFPYEWYETPNIHFLSVTDFERLAEQKGLRIDHREFLAGERRITWLPNLRAEVAVFLFG
jgi:methionine biosynthesis protein MetW